MLKVLEINGVPYGSTCGIMLGIAEVGKQQGLRIDTASGYSYHPVKELPPEHIHIGGAVNKTLHMVLARLTGYAGYFSILSTWRLLRRMERENYDIVHLHNIHGWYINFPMLFGYIKKHHIRVVWTLHDCWTMTGQCPHFTLVKCEKWKIGCHDCEQLHTYPQTCVDRTAYMWRKKREWFTGVEDLTIVTPSRWLAGLVKQSYLKEYPVQVINNGIDLNVFKPTASDFRSRYACGNKYIVLGVSFGWNEKKGLDVFIDLAKRLDDRFQIVLVGTDSTIDKQLPENIISIHCTQNQSELVEIYTVADVFANPTREEVLGLVNIEALACGTPVVTFQTGGSPECIDGSCGISVPCDDIDAMEAAVRHVCEDKPFSSQTCMAHSGWFDAKTKFQEYIELYKSKDIPD